MISFSKQFTFLLSIITNCECLKTVQYRELYGDGKSSSFVAKQIAFIVSHLHETIIPFSSTFAHTHYQCHDHDRVTILATVFKNADAIFIACVCSKLKYVSVNTMKASA